MDKILILNRIKEHLNFKSDSELAQFLGIHRATLSNWKSRNTIDFDILFSKCEQMDKNWLLDGVNSCTQNVDHSVTISKSFKKDGESTIDDQLVPLYDLEATAGLKELFDTGAHVKILDTIKIPNLPKCDGAVTVTGDSMYPLLKSGDIVLYRQISVEHVFYGEMYLLSVKVDEWDEYITVKYVQKSDLGQEYFKLVSQNINHQSKDIHVNSVTAIAIIKASIRINTMN